MTELTPEAVKAALYHTEPVCQNCGQPQSNHPYRHPFVSRGRSTLDNMAPDLARDWLRLKEENAVLRTEKHADAEAIGHLKEVEKAGKALERAAEACLPSTDEPLSHDAALRLIFTKRAFRAAVDGK